MHSIQHGVGGNRGRAKIQKVNTTEQKTESAEDQKTIEIKYNFLLIVILVACLCCCECDCLIDFSVRVIGDLRCRFISMVDCLSMVSPACVASKEK